MQGPTPPEYEVSQTAGGQAKMVFSAAAGTIIPLCGLVASGAVAVAGSAAGLAGGAVATAVQFGRGIYAAVLTTNSP